MQFFRWLSIGNKKGNHLFSTLLLTIAICLCSLKTVGATDTKNIYITFSPLTCLNCSANLYTICGLPEVKKITVLIPTMFQGDSTELVEKYEFNKQPKLSLVFSDSMYNSKVKNQAYPEIIIEQADGKVLFRKVLTIAKNAEVAAILNDEKTSEIKVKREVVCIGSVIKKNPASIYKLDHYIVERGFIQGDYSLVNFKDTTAQKIKLQSEEYAKIYKVFLKDSFQYKYPALKDFFTNTPVWKPTIDGVIEYKNNIYAVINIKDYYYQGGEDTGIYGRVVVGKWDVKKEQFIAYYTIDKTIKDKAWGPEKLYIVQSKLFGKFLKNNTNDFCFYELAINEKLKTIYMVKEMPIYKPQLYTQLNVASYYERNVTVNSLALAFDFADSLYIFSKKQYIKIPFSKTNYDKYEDRMIRDVYSDGTNHAVYYVENNHNFYLLQFNDNGEKRLIPLGSKESRWVTRFYNSANTLVLKNLETGCYEIWTFPPL